MTFREAIDAMSRRKVAMVGHVEPTIVDDMHMRLLCAGTGVDYDDVEEIAKLITANIVHLIVVDGAPLVQTIEGMLIDALLTGHLAGSAEK